MLLKVITWNINSVRLRLPLLERLVQEHQPDVICLQETKCSDNNFPLKAIRGMGYEHTAIHGQKGYHGVAILSRLPLFHPAKIDFCQKGDSRHISAKIDAGGFLLDVHSVYVPAGGDEPDPEINPKFAHKLQFLEEMQRHLPCPGETHALLLGDLNVAPYESDVWSHRQLLKVVSHTPIETELFEKMRQSAGWIDLMRQHIPIEERLYTWWSYRARDWKASNRGRRLDHIWGSPVISQKLHSLDVLTDSRGWDKPSDHAPVKAVFQL
jgi:exodeoxyribonuclease-3